MKKVVLAAALTAIVAVAGGNALAQQDSNKVSNAKADRMICRNIREVGSRIASHRVCMTSTQWAEQRRQQRQDVERQQQIAPGASGH
jgi:hypothetical protein